MILQPLQLGAEVPPLTMDPITKVQLLKYAGAAGDFNLLHTDVETARAAGMDDVIAHGMLSMAFLGRYLTDLAGPERVRRLQARFKSTVCLGDVLTCKGTVRALAAVGPDRLLVTLEIWAENQKGEKVTIGEGEIYVKA